MDTFFFFLGPKCLLWISGGGKMLDLRLQRCQIDIFYSKIDRFLCFLSRKLIPVDTFIFFRVQYHSWISGGGTSGIFECSVANLTFFNSKIDVILCLLSPKITHLLYTQSCGLRKSYIVVE